MGAGEGWDQGLTVDVANNWDGAWGGHPDLSFFLESYHSSFIKPAGEIQPPRNLTRDGAGP